jgi:hypothetical protein
MENNIDKEGTASNIKRIAEGLKTKMKIYDVIEFKGHRTFRFIDQARATTPDK